MVRKQFWKNIKQLGTVYLTSRDVSALQRMQTHLDSTARLLYGMFIVMGHRILRCIGLLSP